jgi:hypothetical protein
MNGDPFRSSCHAGALTRIAEALEERIRRLGDLAERMAASAARAKADPAAGVSAAAIAEQEAFAARWPWMRDALAVASADADLRAPDGFLDAWSRSPAAGGMESALKALSPEARRAGEAWLQAAVDRVSALWPEGAGAA